MAEIRTDDQLKGAIQAAATLARQLETDPMSTPQYRQLAESLHDSINRDLDTLDSRR